MNSKKIEQLSVEELRKVINLHDLMSAQISEGDKAPSYDGNILLYTSKDQKVEELKYQVPVQVKGKNDSNLLKRSYITYPVPYKHLRNYYSGIGVCYFVVVISDDGTQLAIFYCGLTTLKLRDLLKDSENKNPNQRKSITLKRIKNNNSKELYKELMQFGHDSQKLGSGNADIIKNTIELKDLKNVDQFKLTAYASNVEEAIHRVEEGEACLFAHVLDSDIWRPLSYEEQKKIEFHKNVKIHKSFGIDETIYYDQFTVEEWSNMMRFKLSENLYIDLPVKQTSDTTRENVNGTIKFTPISSIKQIKNDIQFLLDIEIGSMFTVNHSAISHYENVRLPEGLKNQVEDLTAIINALDTFDIVLEDRLDSFTDDRWTELHRLVHLYTGLIRPNDLATWYVWRWENKALPFFLVNTENGTKAFPYYDMQEYVIGDTVDNMFYPIPAFFVIKRDVWEVLFNPNEQLFIDEIDKVANNKVTIAAMGQLYVEVLAAYDTTKNEMYYRMADLLSQKLQMFQPNEDAWVINRYQIYYRKRDLNDDECYKLDDIASKAEVISIKCAAQILLCNKYQAKRLIEKMSNEEREMFMTYPIYTLLKGI